VRHQTRPTVHFLVCVRHTKNYHYKNPDLQVILDELKRGVVAISNAFYFGASVQFDNAPESVATCCPYLLLQITNESVARRAKNDFMLELVMLLFSEGASISKMWFDEDMKDMKKEIRDAKIAITDASSEHLCEQYKNTTTEMFDAWTPAQRALYASKKMVTAYNRLNSFRLNGPNHTAVLAILKARYIHACVATQHAANSNQFDMNLIAMAELDAGVRNGHYDYFAYSLSDELLCMYTGVGDPYQVNSIFESAVQRNLECNLEGKNMMVSEINTRAIFNIYTRWVALDPVRHTPSYLIPETDRLNFKQAMTILNQILRFMNVMELIRGNKRVGKRGHQDHLLIMDKYSHFAEDVDIEDKMELPVLDQWNKFPHPLSDPDVLMTNPNLSTIAVADAYLPSTRTTSSTRYGSRKVKATDFNKEEASNVKCKKAKGKPKQAHQDIKTMTTMEKREAKKEQRKVRDEKLKKIKENMTASEKHMDAVNIGDGTVNSCQDNGTQVECQLRMSAAPKQANGKWKHTAKGWLKS